MMTELSIVMHKSRTLEVQAFADDKLVGFTEP